MAQAHDVSMVTYACGTTCDLTEEHFVNTNASDFLDLLELLSEHHINEDLAEDALQAKKLLFQHLQQREEYLTQLQEGLPVATVDIVSFVILEQFMFFCMWIQVFFINIVNASC